MQFSLHKWLIHNLHFPHYILDKIIITDIRFIEHYLELQSHHITMLLQLWIYCKESRNFVLPSNWLHIETAKRKFLVLILCSKSIRNFINFFCNISTFNFLSKLLIEVSCAMLSVTRCIASLQLTDISPIVRVSTTTPPQVCFAQDVSMLI